MPPSGMIEKVRPRIEAMIERYREITGKMGDPSVSKDHTLYMKLAKDQSELSSIVEAYERFCQMEKERSDLDEIRSDPSMSDLIGAEEERISREISSLEEKLLDSIFPPDPFDQKNLYLEIRAGAGGDEAGLFARELGRLYMRFMDRHQLKAEIMETSDTEIGGSKEIVIHVQGRGAYSLLKFESGVHRVQRVPVTEAGGRIHTSTVTVAVMPEADEVDVQIDAKDLRIDTFCASSAGGQSVNTTYSAVRITHIPSNIVVSCQDERSQLKNRAKAMKVLRSRLLEREMSRQNEIIASDRKSQVGSGDRSERIRTYNFPQNRVTDHRVGLTLYQLDQVMEGEIDPFIGALRAQERAREIEQFG